MNLIYSSVERIRNAIKHLKVENSFIYFEVVHKGVHNCVFERSIECAVDESSPIISLTVDVPDCFINNDEYYGRLKYGFRQPVSYAVMMFNDIFLDTVRYRPFYQMNGRQKRRIKYGTLHQMACHKKNYYNFKLYTKTYVMILLHQIN